MLKSMTAFGRARSSVGGKDITVEIRSVNNRFFDCSVKLPRSFSFLEEKVKPYLQSKSVTRGKVDVYIGIDVLDSPIPDITIDEGYTAAYVAALKELADKFSLTNDISVMQVAQNRDIFVIKKSEDDLEKDWADIKVVFDEALGHFLQRRETEGQKLYESIDEKICNIKEYLKVIAKNSENDIKGYAEKLENRILKFLNDNSVQIDEQRILTEVAIYADKVAIDEELVRLGAHFDAFYDIVRANEPSGRKLDFLLQEMNRETNTIGSKASNTETAHLVVNIKNELEKIREQVQNIE